MTDYISREAALEVRVSEGLNDDGILFVPYKDVTRYLQNLPAADVVEVVRCRECAWGMTIREGGEYVLCGKPYAAPWETQKVDYFCADGKRKEDTK